VLRGRLGFFKLGRWIYDEGPIGHGLHLDRLLEETPKEETPELRAAAVEAKGKLVEIRLEVVYLHGPLMGPEQPSFEQACDAMNAGQGYVGRVAGSGHGMGIMQVVVANGQRVR
jgi:hypothetical protein